jgi:hypothetical protein
MTGLQQRTPVFLALHVPKCAGSTLERHMRERLPPRELWITKKRRPGFVRVLSARAYHVPGNLPLESLRLVSGHYVGASIERLIPARSVKKCVLLRDPYSFHISYYNYRMMRYLSLGLKTYDFYTHLKSQRQDAITHFLLSTWLELSMAKLLTMEPAQKLALVQQSFARFWFVGDYSRCDELCRELSAELGISQEVRRQNTREQWQERVSWKPLTAIDLDAREWALLKDRNKLDLALWESWKDAGFNTAGVRVGPHYTKPARSFALTECARPAFATRRRLQRGWG